MSFEKTKRVLLDIFAILLIGWGIAAILNSLYNHDSGVVFWFCYAALILLGIGIFTRSGYLIMSQLSILTIPVIFWNIDFIYALFNNGQTLWNIVDYFFSEGKLLGRIISLQHLFTLPIAYLALYWIKLNRYDAWKVGMAEMAVVFLVSRLFTPSSTNVNCAFSSCVSFIHTNSFYPLVWFIVVFMGIFVTNFLVSKMRIFVLHAKSFG